MIDLFKGVTEEVHMQNVQSVLLAMVCGFTLGVCAGCGGDSNVVDEPADLGATDGPSDVNADGVGDGSGDPGVIVDDPAGGGDDVGEVPTYPQPGTVEYWLDIIPGTWKQTDPETGNPFCVTVESPETCEVELSFEPLKEVTKPYCSGAEWGILGEFGLIGGLCLWNDGSVGRCTTQTCDVGAEGHMYERIVNEGECSQKKDDDVTPLSCARHADCTSLSPFATCDGARVEYWLEFCQWNVNAGSTDCKSSGNARQYYRKITE